MKPDLFAEVNGTIRRLAAETDPHNDREWEFVCECGADKCTEHLGLRLDEYDELKDADTPLLAPGHALAEARETQRRARALRGEAAALREESTALRNQAEHQQRRSTRIAENRNDR